MLLAMPTQPSKAEMTNKEAFAQGGKNRLRPYSFDDFVHHGEPQVLFGSEVMIQRTLGQPGIGQNTAKAGRLKTVAVNFVKRRCQNFVARTIKLLGRLFGRLRFRYHGDITYKP